MSFTCQRDGCEKTRTEKIPSIYEHTFEKTGNELEIDGKFYYEEACECGQTRPGEEIEKTEEPTDKNEEAPEEPVE